LAIIADNSSMKTLNLALVLSLLLTSGPGWAVAANQEGDQVGTPQAGTGELGIQNPFQNGNKGRKSFGGSGAFVRCQKMISLDWSELQALFIQKEKIDESFEEYFTGAWKEFVDGKGKIRDLEGRYKAFQSGNNKNQIQNDIAEEINKKINGSSADDPTSAHHMLREMQECAALIPLTSISFANGAPERDHIAGNSKDGCRAAGVETVDYPACLNASQALAGSQVAGAINERMIAPGVASMKGDTTGIDTSTTGGALDGEIKRTEGLQAGNNTVAGGKALTTGVLVAFKNKIPTLGDITEICNKAVGNTFGAQLFNTYLEDYLLKIAEKFEIPPQSLSSQQQPKEDAPPASGAATQAREKAKNPTAQDLADSNAKVKQCFEHAEKDAGSDPEISKPNASNEDADRAAGKYSDILKEHCINAGGGSAFSQPSNVCALGIASGAELLKNQEMRDRLEEQATADGMAGILELIKGLMNGMNKDKLAEAKKDLENMKADPNLAPKLGKFDASKMKGNPFKLPEDFCVKNPKDPKCAPTSIPKSDRTVSPTIGGLNFSGGDPNRAQGISGNGEDAVPLAHGGVDLNDTPPDALGDLETEGFNSAEFIDPKVAAGGVTRTIGAGGGGGAAGVGGTGLPGSGAAPKAPSDPSKKASSNAVGDAYKNISGGAYRNLAAGNGGNNREDIDPFKKFRDGAGTKGSVLNYRGPASQISNGDLFQAISTAYQKANTKGKLLEYVYKEGNEDAELKDPDLGL
jgi:hypothetical protein